MRIAAGAHGAIAQLARIVARVSDKLGEACDVEIRRGYQKVCGNIDEVGDRDHVPLVMSSGITVRVLLVPLRRLFWRARATAQPSARAVALAATGLSNASAFSRRIAACSLGVIERPRTCSTPSGMPMSNG